MPQRVEFDPDPAVPARYVPMVNPEVDARPAVTKTRNDENGRRISITKKMVSEFGATLGCNGCLVIGQPHTEECPAPSDGRTATKRLGRQEAANTRAPSSSAGAAVDVRSMSTGKRPFEPGGDMVRGLDVCELNEYDAYVNDYEGDYADEVTGVTLLRDDVAKARTEEMGWHERVQGLRRGDRRKMCAKNGTQAHLFSLERHQQR